jgi:hypothetical protein
MKFSIFTALFLFFSNSLFANESPRFIQANGIYNFGDQRVAKVISFYSRNESPWLRVKSVFFKKEKQTIEIDYKTYWLNSSLCKIIREIDVTNFKITELHPQSK